MTPDAKNFTRWCDGITTAGPLQPGWGVGDLCSPGVVRWSGRARPHRGPCRRVR